MHVTIAQVDEVYFDGEAESLTVPATDGEMTVLKGHMPVITTLKAGTVTLRLRDDAPPRTLAIKGGILEVTQSGAVLIL